MRKHYLISAGSFAACFFLIFTVVTMIPSRLGVTKANFDRIEKGMTFADVSSLLGELPGIDNIPAVAKHSFVVWVAGDGATAEISFNNGLVDDSGQTPPERFSTTCAAGYHLAVVLCRRQNTCNHLLCRLRKRY